MRLVVIKDKNVKKRSLAVWQWWWITRDRAAVGGKYETVSACSSGCLSGVKGWPCHKEASLCFLRKKKKQKEKKKTALSLLMRRQVASSPELFPWRWDSCGYSFSMATEGMLARGGKTGAHGFVSEALVTKTSVWNRFEKGKRERQQNSSDIILSLFFFFLKEELWGKKRAARAQDKKAAAAPVIIMTQIHKRFSVERENNDEINDHLSDCFIIIIIIIWMHSTGRSGPHSADIQPTHTFKE